MKSKLTLEIPQEEQKTNQEFANGLNAWVNEDDIDEKQKNFRRIANQKILECRKTNSTALYLMKSGLTSVPAEIGDLTQLTDLYLGDNKIKTVSPELGKLTKLVRLVLKNNEIKTIPAEIGYLMKLKELFLNGNEIKTIPAKIGNILKKEYPEVDKKLIDAIPDFLFNKNWKSSPLILVNGNKIEKKWVDKIKELKAPVSFKEGGILPVASMSILEKEGFGAQIQTNEENKSKQSISLSDNANNQPTPNPTPTQSTNFFRRVLNTARQSICSNSTSVINSVPNYNSENQER